MSIPPWFFRLSGVALLYLAAFGTWAGLILGRTAEDAIPHTARVLGVGLGAMAVAWLMEGRSER